MFNLTRLLSVKDDYPEKGGEVHINVTLHNPPEITEFEGEDVLFVKSTVSVTMANIAEVMMKGETLYSFKNNSEKQNCVTHIRDHNRMTPDLEKEIMNQIGPRAILSLVKAHSELGIPPPVPLPHFEVPK